VSSAGFRPTGRFAGGAGGVGFALAAPFTAGVCLAAAGAGGGGGREAAGGGGGGACFTSSRYAAGAQPEAEWSRRFASHQPVILLAFVDHEYSGAVHTIVFLLCDDDNLVFPETQFAARLSSEIVHSFELRVLRRRGLRRRRWRRRRHAT
jgi:hypothetical protein